MVILVILFLFKFFEIINVLIFVEKINEFIIIKMIFLIVLFI